MFGFSDVANAMALLMVLTGDSFEPSLLSLPLSPLTKMPVVIMQAVSADGSQMLEGVVPSFASWPGLPSVPASTASSPRGHVFVSSQLVV